MNLGLIISMYDEIEETTKSVKTFKEAGLPVIVIQSDPNIPSKILDKNLVDYYEMLPDMAGNIESYLKERKIGKGLRSATKALTRNFSRAFKLSRNFNVDWWVVISGDVVISNLSGIKKIIKKMINQNKSIGITRAVGQVFKDGNDELTRIQREDTTDFMTQFFIVKSDLAKNGLFNEIQITNPFTTEQCMGDEVVRFCNEDSTTFSKLCYMIADYAYPQFIEGLQYNPDKVKMPRYVDGLVNSLRRIKLKLNHK